MKIKQHIPNAITCCNLLCGCLAIVKIFDGDLITASYLVGLASVFDFFDGFAARLLKVSSAIGKDLDSLADMVTFGVVPGFMLFHLINKSLQNESFHQLPKELSLLAFIIIIFSAIRLAKFNNDTRQTDSFIGVPTPAVAIFISSIPLLLNQHSDLIFLLNPYLLCCLALILSFLLISELPLFALKFKHFKWKENEIRFSFLALSLMFLITLQYIGVALIIIFYIIMSFFIHVFMNKKVKR